MTTLRLAVHPTPVGDVLIATGDDGIVELHPLRETFDELSDRLSRTHRADVALDPRKAGRPRRQLDEYFAGRRRVFDLPLCWNGVHGFHRAALAAVCDIPFGETAGYGEVAAMAGSPRAARAVGTACASTPFSIVVRVHRVVRSDGSLGEYGGRPELKAQLLRLERAVIEQADHESAG